ncbi:MAG: phenylalanine--tRNA ligase subunit alpha [Candidatus Lokiarchaeota archaeon]|nr:phenylalanine--tRNA ligase subunit alpha [Candidatus Lokiarchaeota archaeon]
MTQLRIKEISLHVLKELRKFNKPIEARDLSKKTGLEYEVLMTQAIHELQTLESPLVDFKEKEVTELIPTEELKDYVKNGLPERQLVNFLVDNQFDEISIEEFQTLMEMDKSFFFIGLTNAKRNRWIMQSNATDSPTIYLNNQEAPLSNLEKLIEKFKRETVTVEELPKELKDEVNQLLKRKLVTKKTYTNRTIILTELGKKIDLDSFMVIGEEIPRLTAEMLSDGSWRENIHKLKKFEVQNAGPRLCAGKLHPMTVLINKAREVFLSMGFTEIKGPIVESAFYNFDALFQPQDHPAREMHDTFYLKHPAKAKLPSKKIVNAVKKTHEGGGNSKSLGWGGKWSSEIAKRVLLRTHTTATTIRRLSKIAQNKESLPVKVFSLDRVFRNESVDATHLAEFMQIEGIVVGKNLNLSHLKGYLTEFYKKMGFEKLIMHPDFFPYTEPSLGVTVYVETLGKWHEMGGSGIFRPEVTYPLGIKEPIRVLAWGMGFERLAMLSLQRNDIRDLYRSPLKWLKEIPYN